MKVDEFNPANIENGMNYKFDKYFFSGDKIRAVIIVYIIISLIFNVLYLISFISILRRKPKKRIHLILMSNILLINFVHTFSYLYEWILQNVNNNSSLYIDNNGIKCVKQDCKNSDYNRIGGLLVGNMDNMTACKTQAFFLVFSSLSQDIIINIFFYLINKTNKLKQKIIIRFLIGAGYVFPIVFAVIYLVIGAFGLNDKFCFIKKFDFDEDIKLTKENQTKYKLDKKYIPLICLFYLIRIINIVISGGFLYKIVNYVAKNKLRKMYIFKSFSFLFVQIITIIIGIIYTLGGMINTKFGRNFVDVYLIVNTIDGVIFPLASYFANKMYKLLCRNDDGDYSIDLLSSDSTDNDVTTNNMTLQNQTKAEDKTGTTNIRDTRNNFDLTY